MKPFILLLLLLVSLFPPPACPPNLSSGHPPQPPTRIHTSSVLPPHSLLSNLSQLLCCEAFRGKSLVSAVVGYVSVVVGLCIIGHCIWSGKIRVFRAIKRQSSGPAAVFSFVEDGNDTSGPAAEFSFVEDVNDTSCFRKFTYKDLELATGNFSSTNLLGRRGRFGIVYKGRIRKNGTGLPVVVKKLFHNGQLEHGHISNTTWLVEHKEWLAEMNVLSGLVHPNLVKAIGYCICIESDRRLLVHEFIPRGSLENHLFKGCPPLPWSIRMKIALGAARGLAFLHENAYICGDFKTSNILLDADYNAKLSDFGLFKAYMGTNFDIPLSSPLTGTYGYYAPECTINGQHTSKTDVYAFGIVLLELLSGRRSIDLNLPDDKYHLLAWARPHLVRSIGFYRLMDPQLEGQFPDEGAKKAVQLAALCVRSNPKARPLMSTVAEFLEHLLSFTEKHWTLKNSGTKKAFR